MEDFVANYRHDLLTPVNHVIGYCELLIEDAQGTNQEAILLGLKSILDQGRHLLQDIERGLPGTPEAGAVDLPAFRRQLLAPVNRILEACDGLCWGTNAAALARLRRRSGEGPRRGCKPYRALRTYTR